MAVQIVEASSAEQCAVIRELFTEYANSLEIDLCFQNFKEELAQLPGPYGPPEGRLFLAWENATPVGCVAVRGIAVGTCEMKRLYVRSAFRGTGLGRRLAQAAIDAARQLGYQRMRLDTLASMKSAIALYESLGFCRIDAYYDNPTGCAVFMELNLMTS